MRKGLSNWRLLLVYGGGIFLACFLPGIINAYMPTHMHCKIKLKVSVYYVQCSDHRGYSDE